MSKKVTIRDVAKEAGVSVATVSYIMNDRKDVKISAETRKKVLQIANLLDYTPSSAAKSLATGRNNIIGVSYRLGSSPSRNLEITDFINLLIERLNRMHYDILFLPINPEQDTLTIRRNIDGIIAVDLSGEEFKRFSDSYLVPIIAVDMVLHDNLFYQVYTNLPAAIDRYLTQNPDSLLVMEPFGNEQYMDYIVSAVKPERLCILSDCHPDTLRSLKNKNLLVIGTYLALMLRPYTDHASMTVITSNAYSHMLPESTTILENDTSKKANVAINLLLNAIDRKFDVNHIYEINIQDTPCC